MIRRIAQKEILETLRDGRFRALAVTITALLLVSLALGWRSFAEVNRQHETGRLATRANWLSQGVKNPHSAAHWGVYAFKPRTPLSFFDTGTDPYTGVAVWLEAHKQNDFRYKPAQDANTLARFGDLTGAAVMQLLIPLLIVLLTFSAVAGERESGILKQLLSLGVSARSLALGKAIGIAGALGIVLIPASLLGATLPVFLSQSGTGGDIVIRILLLAFFYLLYLATFVSVSLTVSAVARSARMALLILLSFWIVNSLIVPRAVSDLARAITPTPSALEFSRNVEHDLEFGMDGQTPETRRTDELRRSLLAKYAVSDVKDLPVSFMGVSLQRSEEHGNQVFDYRYGQLWNLFARQNRVRQLAAVLAPLLSVRSISMALAGTDFDQHRRFAAAAEEYRRFFIQKINADITDHAAGKQIYTRGSDLWRDIPEFQYESPSLAAIVRGQALPILLLVIWAVGAAALLVWATGRIEAIG